MGVYGGNIGPRLPRTMGENCGQCEEGIYVMSPGYTSVEGILYSHWSCSRCGHEMSAPIGRDPKFIESQNQELPETTQETDAENEGFGRGATLPNQIKHSDFLE